MGEGVAALSCEKTLPYGRGSVTNEARAVFQNRDRQGAFAANTSDVPLLTREDKARSRTIAKTSLVPAMRVMERSGVYSYRSAKIGSIRLALRAGINPASRATTISITMLAMAIDGSLALMP